MVATPIGNLGDITLRAIETLSGADIVVCEDTRHSGKLLKAHGITKWTIAYHDHSDAKTRAKIITRLENGEIVALISDAGTPMVSDPGYRLVRDAVEAGISVTAVPGPSSVTSALVLSALPSDRFFFQGFLPAKSAARRRVLEEIKEIPSSLVIMESPRRLAASLADMEAVLGSRAAVVAREITKLHEEVRRGDLRELAAHYKEAETPKGEVTLVVGPPPPVATPEGDELDEMIAAALATSSVKEAAATVAGATGLARRTVYARALEIRNRDS